MTTLRRESFDTGFVRIWNTPIGVAPRPEMVIIFPVYSNLNVQLAIEPLRRCHGIRLNKRVNGPELDFLFEQRDFAGRVLKEAPSFGKPATVTREVTERPVAKAC